VSWTNVRNMSELHKACARGDWKEVTSLLNNENINTQNRKGETPLQISSKYNDLDTIKVLISREECNLNTADAEGNTPLHTACKHGHCSTVEFLVADERCQLNTQNRGGETPVYIATKHGNLNTVKVLTSRKECNFSIPDEQGNTALHIACMYDHIDIVQFLVADERCLLNTKNSEMNTPLHIACQIKSLRIIRLLLDRKCHPNIPNKKGETAEEIPLNEDGDHLLHIACRWGDADIVRYLVTDQRCNPNITNTSNCTPLLIASKHAHLDVAKVLVSRKDCDFNIPDGSGNTPLHTACKYVHHSTVQSLFADQKCPLDTKIIPSHTKLFKLLDSSLTRKVAPIFPTRRVRLLRRSHSMMMVTVYFTLHASGVMWILFSTLSLIKDLIQTLQTHLSAHLFTLLLNMDTWVSSRFLQE